MMLSGVPFMSVEEIILYLRQQLLELRSDNDRQAVSELLSTFKMLTKISFENDDKQLTDVLVDLTDAARHMYLNHPVTSPIPTEEAIRRVVNGTTTEAVATAAPVAVAANGNGKGAPHDEPKQIKSITTQEIGVLEVSFDHEAHIQQRLRAVALRDWNDHAPIRDGSQRQMQAYSVVYDDLMLFHSLKRHEPLWVGAFPLNIDIDGSTIDVLCNPESLRPFLHQVKDRYGNRPNFRLTWKAIDRVPTVLARFAAGDFIVELFAQPRPTTAQVAFIHMEVQARLLALGGPAARSAIQALMRDGLSTEAAFVQYFKLSPANDPAEKLLALARTDNDALRRQLGIDISG